MNPKQTYSEKLKDPRWQKKRLFVMERDSFQCQLCFDTETTLNVHHKKYFGNPWDCPDEFLITICAHCHYVITHFRVDIIELPFGQCMKTRSEAGYCLFFCGDDFVIIATTHKGEFISIEKFPNKVFRDVVQTIINNWLFTGKDHLLIDQSPVLI